MSESIIIFLFHRDLRLYDHRPLQAALDAAKEIGATVLPLFVFEPAQASTRTAPVRSENSISCLLQSLKELDTALPGGGLCIKYGAVEDVLRQIGEVFTVAALYETRDYTPYAVAREEKIKKICEKMDAQYIAVDDLYIFTPGTVLTGTGKVYQKFTPFYDNVKSRKVIPALGKVHGKFAVHSRRLESLSLQEITDKLLTAAQQIAVEKRRYHGGRKEGLQLLERIPRDYEEIHDDLTKEQSGLSVHHHYGTISCRESWFAGKGITAFQRQLLWRDFYGHLVAAWNDLYGARYGDLHAWVLARPKLTAKQQEQLTAWQQGTTGIPLVDAAMHQLNTSGFMHNRGRLVVASVLGRDWGIPWQYGAAYFAECLGDYDYVQNTMNWLNVVEHFPWSQAPFRRHDPERTQERLDPDCVYVKRWLSEN